MPTSLTPGELTILQALDGGAWRSAIEISVDTSLHVQNVRAMAKELTRRQLIQRGAWGDQTHWGEFRITDAGAREMAERGSRGQLSIVDELEASTGEGRR